MYFELFSPHDEGKFSGSSRTGCRPKLASLEADGAGRQMQIQNHLAELEDGEKWAVPFLYEFVDSRAGLDICAAAA
jgi:hypothetical protein